jgi:hypothetical protein
MQGTSDNRRRAGTVTPRDNPAVDQQGRSTLGYNRADDRNRRLNPGTFLRPLRDDFKINMFYLFSRSLSALTRT